VRLQGFEALTLRRIRLKAEALDVDSHLAEPLTA